MRQTVLLVLVAVLTCQTPVARTKRKAEWTDQQFGCVAYRMPSYLGRDVTPRMCIDGCGVIYRGRGLSMEITFGSSLPSAGAVPGHKESRLDVGIGRGRIVEYYIPSGTLTAPKRVLVVGLEDTCAPEDRPAVVNVGSDPNWITLRFICDDERARRDARQIIASLRDGRNPSRPALPAARPN